MDAVVKTLDPARLLEALRRFGLVDNTRTLGSLKNFGLKAQYQRKLIKHLDDNNLELPAELLKPPTYYLCILTFDHSQPEAEDECPRRLQNAAQSLYQGSVQSYRRRITLHRDLRVPGQAVRLPCKRHSFQRPWE